MDAKPTDRYPDPDALEAAIAADGERLRCVALRITRDAADADDVVQNAFEKALRHRERFRGEAKLSTWLHRIVVNEALMWRRAQVRRRARTAQQAEPLTAASADPGPLPLDALLAAERHTALHRALAALRPDDADLLLYCAVEENGYASWALRRGMHAAAAKTRAFRARRALRGALESFAPAG